jgi:hypothetical protein
MPRWRVHGWQEKQPSRPEWLPEYDAKVWPYVREASGRFSRRSRKHLAGGHAQSDHVSIRFVPGRWRVPYLDRRTISESHRGARNMRSRQPSGAVATVGEAGNGQRSARRNEHAFD